MELLKVEQWKNYMQTQWLMQYDTIENGYQINDHDNCDGQEDADNVAE